MVNDPNSTYKCIPVCSDTLEHFGVKEGDYLIVRETDCLDEDSISVWDTPDGRTAKFAYENFGDITLYNKKDWLRSYPEKDVKLIGIAEAVQKRLEMA
jgi:SOS-response transcriptional repressor LexA